MDEVEEVKRRIDIVDLISSYLTLKKAGANYRALCPFHNEKTPSLMVSPEKQIFKCFGCNEGGDAFSFIMKMENLEFREALEMLAQRAGVKLKPRRNIPPDEKPDKKSRLFEINALSAKAYHKILTSHPAGRSALEYLKKRRLSNQTIEDFLIGYAPSKKVLALFLKKHGFSEQEVQNAGGPDRFYKRIIFPIRDVMGNVLGFTGRVLEPKQEPKYLNTPETIIFHKGRILFNLEKARGEIKLQKATVVVEGQMDVIASWQAGVKNVVATSGTALTPEHLQILFRYTPNIIFAFDSDSAGMSTAKKAYEMAIEEGFNVKMVDLGDFKDPGEMIAKDPELWRKAVNGAEPVIDWYFGLAFKRQGAGSSELTSVRKKEIAREILPIIKKIPDTIEQAHFIGLLAKRLGIPEQIVFDALSRQENKEVKKKIQVKTPEHISLSPEEIFVAILLKCPQKIKEIVTEIKPDDFNVEVAKKVYTRLYNWYNNGEKEKVPEEKEFAPTLFQISEMLEPEKIDAIFAEVTARIKSNRKENIKDLYAKEIALAERKGDREKLKTLIKEFQDAISK